MQEFQDCVIKMIILLGTSFADLHVRTPAGGIALFVSSDFFQFNMKDYGWGCTLPMSWLAFVFG